MDKKEQSYRKELAALEIQLQDPAIFSDKNYPKLAKRKANLEAVMDLFNEKTKLLSDREAAEALRSNSESSNRKSEKTKINLLPL
jgi:protein subunit release factor A